MIIEAKKSQDLESANWGSRKLGGVVSVQVQVWKQETLMSQLKNRQAEKA